MGASEASLFQRITDKNSTVHKLLTYGVAVVIIAACAFMSPGEGVNPAIGWLVIGFLFYYAILSQRILETLTFGMAIGVALAYGRGFLDGLSETIFATMMLEDFVWIVLLTGLLNVFCKLLGRAGSLDAFADIVKSRAKTGKQLNVATWLMQFPFFFDDYLHLAVGGSIMAPIYDEMGVPREEGAYINHTIAEPLRVLFPITSWAAFMAGLFESGGLDGMSGFISTIPFSFYAWVSIIFALLFALGFVPKIGPMKEARPELYQELDAGEEEAEDDGTKKGTLWDFFIPIILMVAFSYYFEWDIVPALFVTLPIVFAMYLIRGIISTEDVEGCLVDGLADFMALYILFVTSYALGGILEELGYIDYLVSMAQTSVNPAFLPVLLFVLFSISEAAMSLNWSLMLIAFPVVIPLAIGIGANVPLTCAAVISAGCFGCNFCYICDYTELASTAWGLPAGRHASTCVPYSLICGVITAVLYLACGFVL